MASAIIRQWYANPKKGCNGKKKIMKMWIDDFQYYGRHNVDLKIEYVLFETIQIRIKLYMMRKTENILHKVQTSNSVSDLLML